MCYVHIFVPDIMGNIEGLFKAVNENDVSEVTRLVTTDMSLLYATDEGFTALQYAAQLGHSEVCNILLLYGADVNTTLPNSLQTPLHSAALRGHVDTVDILLEHQANVHAKTYQDYTPLYWACQEGQTECALLLCRAGARLTDVTKHGDAPIHSAALKGHTNTVKALVGWGCDINLVGSSNIIMIIKYIYL